MPPDCEEVSESREREKAHEVERPGGLEVSDRPKGGGQASRRERGDRTPEQLEAEDDSERGALEATMARFSDEREEGRIRDEDGRSEGPEQSEDDGGASGSHAEEARDPDEGIAGREEQKASEPAAHAAEEEGHQGSREDPDCHRDLGDRIGETEPVMEEERPEGREDRECRPAQSQGKEPQSDIADHLPIVSLRLFRRDGR